MSIAVFRSSVGERQPGGLAIRPPEPPKRFGVRSAVREPFLSNEGADDHRGFELVGHGNDGVEAIVGEEVGGVRGLMTARFDQQTSSRGEPVRRGGRHSSLNVEAVRSTV